jgi:hypothetical protein
MIEIEMGNRGSKSDPSPVGGRGRGVSLYRPSFFCIKTKGVYRKYIYGVCKRATSRWFFSSAI